MSSTRTFSIIGAAEETVAHIRLLLRLAGPRLEHAWELREADEADLILIEPKGDLATSAIQTRCAATGIPYAVLCDQDDLVVHGMVLRRPLKLESLVAIFNTAGGMRQDTRVMAGLETDFYNAELGEQIPSTTGSSGWDAPEHALAEVSLSTSASISSDALDAFDLLVHGDPVVEPVPEPPLVDENTRVEQNRGENSARSTLKRDAGTRAAASLLGVASIDMHEIRLTPASGEPRPVQAASSCEPGVALLPWLLESGVLRSPQHVHGQDLPDLVLDPKERRYYSNTPLQELLPYAKADSSLVQHQGIVGAALQRVRASRIPRPFDELRWLFALARSNGRLAPELDPGGSYAVHHPFAAAPDLRGHARITAAMAAPAPLHSIARSSGADMSDVFDIINAYAAIGRIECTPRRSLRASPENTEKRGFWGLFSRK